MGLVESLIKDRWLKTPEIINAFREVKRKDFMSEGVKHLAELNEAIPIGWNQTISQPLVVAFMLEQLKPKLGHKILDIGSGSGWTTALLSHIVGPKGKVIAIEVIPELKEFGQKNVSKYSDRARFVLGDGRKGFKNEAPFDRILVSAALDEKKIPWKNQLKTGGIIVVPIRHSIWVFEKKEKGFKEKEYPGFSFVPFV